MKSPKSLVSRILAETKPADLRATVSPAQIIKECKAAAHRSAGRLTEAKIDDPLEKKFVKYIKDGEVFSPCGDVKLVDSLDACPYAVKQSMTGVYFERVKAVTDEILKFDNSIMDKVVQECDKFWNSRDRYSEFGYKHTKGILLYGPPGSSKSTCLQQVTEMMSKRGDVVLFADSASTISAGIKTFKSIEPSRPVVIVFEEADEVFNYNEREMLRLMDGDGSVSGVLYCATTNYIERLSERALRPGRFSKLIYVGMPPADQRRQYLEHKLKNVKEKVDIDALVSSTNGFGFGHLRELIAGVYVCGEPLDEVLGRLKKSVPKNI